MRRAAGGRAGRYRRAARAAARLDAGVDLVVLNRAPSSGWSRRPLPARRARCRAARRRRRPGGADPRIEQLVIAPAGTGAPRVRRAARRRRRPGGADPRIEQLVIAPAGTGAPRVLPRGSTPASTWWC
ncbi:hypothetical protein [Burkholderia plantarii]|uniref:hypothetical protein n=1 Tax=Burkholderia plantarii TaxID=41899 RepID=UPI00158B0055|nr:hypothetical protein [Burkholderia plantarii]